MLRRALVLVVFVVLVVTAGSVLAACGGGDDDGASSGDRGASGRPDREAQPLVGTEWVLDQAASGLAASLDAVVTAQFSSDGSLTGNGGCNQYRTTYTVDGARLRVTGPVAGTLMACAPAVMTVEQEYLDRLPSARSHVIAGRVLTITTAGARPLVYRALDPEQALAGDWVVVSYFRPGAVTSPVAGSTLTARFEDDRISGSSGCNEYSGPYAVDDTLIEIGPLVSTLRACADPAVGEQEAHYLAALELARTFSLARGNLTLLREDGGIAVTFARA